MSFSFIIPAYNEAACIAQAVLRIAAYGRSLGSAWEIVVVDDGSTDGTAEVARRLVGRVPSLRVMSLSQNTGKGAAVRAGMLAARGEWRIFLDADLSTVPEMVARFIPFFGQADIVIGSRAVAGSRVVRHQPLFREWSGRMFNLLVGTLLGLPFADTQCGAKAFHKRTRDLFVKQEFPGWSFDVEVLVRATLAGWRVKEVPVVWINDPSTSVRLASAFQAVLDLFRIGRRRQNW